MSASGEVICAYEDRSGHLIGAKILVSSVARHLPDVPVHLTCPAADESLRSWLRRYPGVHLEQGAELRGQGWDVKPTLLLKILEAGHDSAIWIDTDIVVTGDFRSKIKNSTAFIVAEEDYWNGRKENELRTRGWNLPVGRRLRRLVNSGFIRATRAHIPLLKAWKQLMASPEYQTARLLPFAKRPMHMLTDQDVLASLLGSDEFADVEVQFFRRGREIIQHSAANGYAPVHRVANLVRGAPPLVHSQAAKPWMFEDVPSLLKDPRSFLTFMHLETSTYCHYARTYSDDLGALPDYLRIRSLPGRISNFFSGGNPHLRGLTQATMYSVIEYAGWTAGKGVRLLNKVSTRARSHHA